MYMFPQFSLLSQVIQKLRSTQEGEVILIAPWWASQPWFPHLLRLYVDHLDPFLPQRYTVTTGTCLERRSYHLHAWRLSCSTTKQQDFQKRSLDLSLKLRNINNILSLVRILPESRHNETLTTALWTNFEN